jgi:RNA polymerase sigma-70 factor (ECF subfamily)
MDDNKDYIELVKRAQLGERESLDRLAGLMRARLYAYVYRIVLEQDLAHDIVQETMLEMIRALANLERADRFWPWLRGIALNMIRRKYADEQHRRKVSMSNVKHRQDGPGDIQEGMAKLLSEELKQIVLTGMAQLKPRHRKVLTMRCYEEMEYSEIAELMGCTELGARVLFHRAKRALRKALSRKGFGRGFVPTALVLFGKMTAPSEAAAAKVSITAATVKAGLGAALLEIASSKTAVVSLATAGVLAVGAVVATSGPDKGNVLQQEKPATGSGFTGHVRQEKKAVEECWYYFPESADGPVMMAVVKSGLNGRRSYCAWRQNEGANYRFDRHRNCIYVNNYRMWRRDLRVQRLPTDKPELTEFLSQVEGQAEQMEYVPGGRDGLLVATRRGGSHNSNHLQIIRHYHVLDEEYFRYSWPAGVKLVDNRDAMHKRGWAYFTLRGEIDEQEVSGTGRIPFVYAAGKEHSPWLRVKVGGRLKIVDDCAEALVYGDDGNVIASFHGGTFFKGLGRPWMGLHTIDTVRRDAARQQMWFETKYEPKHGKAQVVLTHEKGTFVYAVDMENDVIEKIAFSTSDGRKGELSFSYRQEVEQAGDEFVKPHIRESYGKLRRESSGMLWLVRLAEGKLGM